VLSTTSELKRYRMHSKKPADVNKLRRAAEATNSH